MPTEEAAPEEVINVGVALSSPGLASGSDPDAASGAEIALAQAIAAELDTMEPEAQVRWVPISAAEDTVAAVQDGEMEFILGQISDSRLTEQLAWVGPYATVEPALLIRQAPDEAEDAATTIEPLKTITSAAELLEVPVCVVANSVADGVDLPVGNVTVQHTVSECEVGMRSGRYDAIAADDLQLAGILTDPNLSSTYELISWSELSEDEDLDVPGELLKAQQYWVGTTPAQCEALTETLRTVVSEGALLEAFSEWEETTGFEPDIATADELTTKHCPS